MKLRIIEPYYFRDAVKDDAESLFSVHRAAMREYVEQIWGWDEEWQRQDFHKKFDSPSNRQVICASQSPIGWLTLDVSPSSVFVGSIVLHPEHQGRGIGSSIFNQLIQYSQESGTILRLQVFKINVRAQTLYENLGFRVCGETEHHNQMERPPEANPDC